MVNYGDIRNISGFNVPRVETVIGGSPCQNLSIAGDRKGLDGQESGLFLEQIRVIRELRQRDVEQRITPFPRFMVWENVEGALQSSKGLDFVRVLLETIKLCEPKAPNILVPSNGWTKSGCYMGREWSIAWRVLDSQFFGVPQRRRRIVLIADFAGQCAPEILFERKSLLGDTKPCRETQEKIATYNGTSIERTNFVFDARGYGNGQTVPPIVGEHNNRITDYTAVIGINGNIAGTLDAHYANTPGFRNGLEREVVLQNQFVRRLTPLECERLQGYPDNWTDIGDWVDSKGKKRKSSDTIRYKALGNSIAIPPWLWVLTRLNKYTTEKTMASLFDGIGGFPLIWEHLNGLDKVLWCSEIDDFPIEVVKRRLNAI